MNYKIYLDKKDGNVWDITNIVSKATLTFKRTGSATTFSFDCSKGDAFHQNNFEFENGDIIKVYIDKKGIFLGYIFKIESKLKDKSYTITCYDQIKYLLYNATYCFVNKKASAIIKTIADDFRLKVGEIADTKFSIPKLVEDNKKLLDIISESLYLTSDNGGGQYCIYDDFGSITLKSLNDMKTEYVISDTTHIEDVTYSKDIEDSYNVFKLVRDNKSTGKRDAFVYQNSELINKWGMLQYFSVVDEGLNDGQIQNQLNALYALKGKEKKSLSIKCIGEFVRAGESVAIIVDDLKIKQYYVIDEAKHTFSGGNVHEMDLKLYIAD